MAPVSPVKRVTRARAAATKTTTSTKATKVAKADVNVPPKKSVASKAAAAAAALAETRKMKTASEKPDPQTETSTRATTRKTTARAPQPLAAAPRRRIKVTPIEPAQPQAEPEVETAPLAKGPPKTTSRAKKPATDTNKSRPTPSTNTAPKTRTARAKATASDDTNQSKPTTSTNTAPKTITSRTKTTTSDDTEDPPTTNAKPTRGRPKKAAIAQVNEPAVSVRQTRTRAASNASNTAAAAAATAKAAGVARKKVTFQEVSEDDKENIPLTRPKPATKKAASTADTGLRAKPIRKPAAKNTATTKKASTAKNAAGKAVEARVLTPKKVTQVARASTPADEEEDELNGGKTPVRDLSLSPKRSINLNGSNSPTKKLDFTPSLPRNSPEQLLQASNMASPARRLPTSPYKDGMKDSPRRGEAVPTFPSATDNVRPNIADMQAMPSQSQSTLLQSPRRGALDNSMFSHSTLKPMKSPFKASLMSSPARRLFSPQKSKQEHDSNANAVPLEQPAKAAASKSPNAAVSCYFRPSQSPDRGMRVHTMTEDELAREAHGFLDFDDSVLNIRSPLKSAKSITSPLRPAFENDNMPAYKDDVDQGNVATMTQQPESAEVAQEAVSEVGFDSEFGGEPMEGVIMTVNASEIEHQAPILSTGFREEEDTSEDELASPEKTIRPSTFDIKGRMSTGVTETARNLGFTPLATQLSGWLASSPGKHSKPSGPQRGLFSPLAAQHIPGEVVISRHSTPQLKKTPSQTTSTGSKKLFTARSSLSNSMHGSPALVSLFEDEMRVRELMENVATPSDHEFDMHQVFEEREQQEQTLPDGTFVSHMHNEELTTDLINQEVFTDTAVIDFSALAEEAEAAHEAKDIDTEEEGHLQASPRSSDYGDENLAPLDDNTQVPQPVLADGVQTPVRPDLSQPRFVNTVISKVPLRPEGNISPIKVAKKRSRSLSAGAELSSSKRRSLEDLRSKKTPSIDSSTPSKQTASPAATTPGATSFAIDDFGDSTLDGIELPPGVDFDETEVVATPPVKNTPTPRRTRTPMTTGFRNPLKTVGGGVLQGAVVHVDVHTSEGADASGIFIDLLTQMGAKCVKDWKWSSRKSITAGESIEDVVATTKPGITHVIYKDGSVKTLEKIRDANRLAETKGMGGVWCVGVGWVLNCERKNKWLEESSYVVDTTIMPRGGSRRRKSMEPKTLLSDNGAGKAPTGRRSVSSEMTEDMKRELVNTPVRSYQPPSMCFDIQREDTIGADEEDDTVDIEHDPMVESTPTGFDNYHSTANMSPMTPYQPNQPSKLVQMTCPPKQTNQGLFGDVNAKSDKDQENTSLAGEKLGDVKDESMRRRLEAVRRKTMGWKPVIGSPLGR